MAETDAVVSAVPLLRPELPDADALLPWLRRIDAARWYTNFGPLVAEFETAIALSCAGGDGVPAVVSLANGTAPLELGLAALGLAPGSSVLLPSFTFPATAGAVVRNGLRPLFADVDAGSWLLTPALARRALARHAVAAVLPVACFGAPVDVAAWDDFVADTGVAVLVDAAAAFGNQRIGRRCPVAFSFHATKPFGVGEGGALVSHDAALADRVRRLSNFGFVRERVEMVGTNAKMSEYAAAVGLAQHARWAATQRRRAAQWQGYRAALEAIAGVRLQQGYAPAAVPANVVVRPAAAPAEVAAALAADGIETRRWYCPPLHLQPAFAAYPSIGPEGDAHLPVTEALARTTLGLPWFPSISAQQCAAVAAALARASERSSAVGRGE